MWKDVSKHYKKLCIKCSPLTVMSLPLKLCTTRKESGIQQGVVCK